MVKQCNKCGLPLKFCNCKNYFYYFDGICSVFENTGKARSVFYDFKFKNNRYAAVYFAKMSADKINGCYGNKKIDFICSVPCHRSTVKNVGYDRVKYFAKLISRKTKTPYRAVLYQPVKTPKQHTSKNISERFFNVKNKYKVKNPSAVQGKNFLLVDDIKTMGATLSEVARQLKLAGANEVFAVTALITYPTYSDDTVCKK